MGCWGGKVGKGAWLHGWEGKARGEGRDDREQSKQLRRNVRKEEREGAEEEKGRMVAREQNANG